MQQLSRILDLSVESLIAILFVILAIMFLVFLIVREFWCWYWKTTKITQLLGEVSDKLSEQNKLQAKIYGYLVKNLEYREDMNRIQVKAEKIPTENDEDEKDFEIKSDWEYEYKE